MYTGPMIRPLDSAGTIYALQDEKGDTIGTGTRAVCEILLYMITKPTTRVVSDRVKRSVQTRTNVRSAIGI
jgi:hypothetical protein